MSRKQIDKPDGDQKRLPGKNNVLILYGQDFVIEKKQSNACYDDQHSCKDTADFNFMMFHCCIFIWFGHKDKGLCNRMKYISDKDKRNPGEKPEFPDKWLFISGFKFLIKFFK
jgi:hypothetical protein